MLTPSFHFNILQDFLVTMNEHSLSLKEKLEDLSVDGKPFNMFHYISLNSLDIICGKSIYCLSVMLILETSKRMESYGMIRENNFENTALLNS